MNSDEKVGVVVVTYNRLVLLKEVIDSLRNQTYENLQIVVVNNGSTDGTSAWLAEQQSDIITITQDNSGGAGGFFTGMKYVAEHGYKYCWVMDDDVICQPNALYELVKAYQIRDDIGFVCSRVVGIDGCPMNTPNASTRQAANGYMDLYDYVAEWGMVRVDSATFVSVLVSVEKIKELGLPYKEYFIWGDDSEYTTRISTLYPSYIACRSIVLHKRVIQKSLILEQEDDMDRLKNYYYKIRNESYNLIKYGYRIHLIRYLLNYFILSVKMLIKFRIRHFLIIWKAYLSLFRFHPVVRYVNKECKSTE